MFLRAATALIGLYLMACIPAFIASAIVIGGHRPVTDGAAAIDVLNGTLLIGAIISAVVIAGCIGTLLIAWALDQ